MFSVIIDNKRRQDTSVPTDQGSTEPQNTFLTYCENKIVRLHILSSIFALGLGLVPGAQAELLNISSNALQSQNSSTAACAIVGSGGKSRPDGRKELAILAEGKTGDSDPKLTVKISDGTVLTNDNWLEQTYENGKPVPNPSDLESWLGRPAGRVSDAGMVIWAFPGEWLCAHSNEKSGGDILRPVSISITDVTTKAGDARSLEEYAPIDMSTGRIVTNLRH